MVRPGPLHLRGHLALFLFTDPPPPEFYTLSLHDALPILHVFVEEDRDLGRRFQDLIDADDDRVAFAPVLLASARVAILAGVRTRARRSGPAVLRRNEEQIGRAHV